MLKLKVPLICERDRVVVERTTHLLCRPSPSIDRVIRLIGEERLWEYSKLHAKCWKTCCRYTQLLSCEDRHCCCVPFSLHRGIRAAVSSLETHTTLGEPSTALDTSSMHATGGAGLSRDPSSGPGRVS